MAKTSGKRAKRGASPKPLVQGQAASLPFFYMFSISMSFNSKQIGDSPTGTTIDVQLDPSGEEITTEPRLYKEHWGRDFDLENLEEITRGKANATGVVWLGIRGKLTNWNDWVLIRRDGVSEFGGRATIQTHDGCLVGVVFSGCLERREKPVPGTYFDEEASSPKPADGSSPISLPRRHVQLAIRFEGGQQPPKWADDQYQEQAMQWKYRRLFRDQFLARGFIVMDKKNLPEKGNFHIWGPGEEPFKLNDDELSSLKTGGS